jgi:hypothetical protein
VSEWKIARKGSACARCERAFAPEEPFVSAIYLAPIPEGGGEGFVREDRCPTCFEAEEREPFSRWTTRLPPAKEKQPLLDMGLAREFLLRLVREDDPSRRNLACILTLLLLRKRKVKLRGQRSEGEATILEVSVPTDEAEAEIEVESRDLSDEETAEITAELSRLFGLGGPDSPSEPTGQTQP